MKWSILDLDIDLEFLIDFNFGPDLNGKANFRVVDFLLKLSKKSTNFATLHDALCIAHLPDGKRTSLILQKYRNQGIFFIPFMHAWMLACNYDIVHIRKFQQLFPEAETAWDHIDTDEFRTRFLEPLHLMWSEIALIQIRQKY